MIALTQEHLGFIGSIVGLIGVIVGVMSAIDRKFEKNNTRLEIMIDKKLDKIVYEEHRKSFEAWTNEKDKILENKINKMENDFKSDLQEIKATLKEINNHILGCEKRTSDK